MSIERDYTGAATSASRSPTRKGIHYGYVCIGEVFDFLYIPDDPTGVYHSVGVPNLDVLDDDENRLHDTAIWQVFAFILQGLHAEPPPASWHDAAATLVTWALEYDDVLRNQKGAKG
ncbi:hypothetical protein CGMCC3_g398 [Colletotrichum fructicola]|uniref:Uncharacterized protein n=1 Tax=Colletotrichum fructicola (strain Nara gc5) TaxID=1213859 RepID=L2G7P7_COLFN|nr:uncharacterized protein CGMCC3_g398 [Colletotrichum fructicola]KAE9583375.1 hypothetical protein CGMCC3_g398 [Colletotrichum fructicola]